MSDIPLLLETKQSKLLDFFNNKVSGDEDGDNTDSDATVEYNCDDHDDDDDNGKVSGVFFIFSCFRPREGAGANQYHIIFEGGVHANDTS